MRTRYNHSHYLLLKLAYLLVTANVVLARPGQDPSAISPIQQLEPSLAASQAQGTAVAVSCKDCVVLLTRSPQSSETSFLYAQSSSESSLSSTTPSQTKSPVSNTDNETNKAETMWGIRIASTSASGSNEAKLKTQCIRLGPSAVCCMTGFLPDVQHLTRVASKTIESHLALYANKPPPVSKIVRSMAGRLDRAARIEGSRPLGVQVLLLGVNPKLNAADVVGNPNANTNTNNNVLVYTLDPTGGWKHCLTSTAVGRHAQGIRPLLLEQRQRQEPESENGKRESSSTTSSDSACSSSDSDDDDAQSALDMAMKALLQGAQVKQDDTAVYDALLVWPSSTSGRTNACRTATIHPDVVAECHRACLQEEE